ncbi:hypothetical protein CA13_50230 [Planctomycetes bacterium CA13]|uniref:Uncharacterized protein n=1 Tax=Novipirellula herctigrandis TaxID=2527986 RepID=A0A5C5Z8Y2_9BACT|nr:hypothetical protein CA13_50230 [Planctomycetes bacterium CA13]
MRNFVTILTTTFAAALLVVAVGCQPPAKKPDVSTDVTVEEATESNTTMAVETPSSNTTTGVETPAGETP